MALTERRLNRIREVAARRQLDATVVIENVHDPHNVGAVMRTCESVGIAELHVIYTDPRLLKRGLQIGKKSNAGARRWIDLHVYDDVDHCLRKVKERYGRILGTHLGQSSVHHFDIDMTTPFALLLGNEHEGLSEKAMHYVDANIYIPQVGMVQSLNISVSCAVILYEMFRQRFHSGLYHPKSLHDSTAHAQLYRKYIRRHEEGYTGKHAFAHLIYRNTLPITEKD